METKLDGSPLRYVNFNQDSNCFSVGKETGYDIFNSGAIYGRCYDKDDGTEYAIVEMLFVSSLLVLVADSKGRSRNLLRIVNTKRESVICEMPFPGPILRVRLNRERMAVVLADEIHVYDMANMKLIKRLATAPNPRGLCSLAPSSETSFIAYPHSDEGHVVVYDPINDSEVNVIAAHVSELAQIELDYSGTMVATASLKGTLIRIYDTLNGEQVVTFRRGSQQRLIYSIAFDRTGAALIASSDSGTVHIYKMPTEEERRERAEGGGGGGSGGGGFLSSIISSVWPWDEVKHFTEISLAAGVKSLCRISVSDALALAVTEEGWYYVYEVDMETGSVRLLAQNNILEAETAGSSASTTSTTSTATVPATATATAAEATAGGDDDGGGDDDNGHGGGA